MNFFWNNGLGKLSFCIFICISSIAIHTEAEENTERCKANLKALYNAFQMYRNDNDGYYPPTITNKKTWPMLIKKYIPDEQGRNLNPDGHFFCPGYDKKKKKNVSGNPIYISYGYNGIALGGGTKPWYPGIRHHKRGPISLINKVPHPAKTILLIDADAANKPYDGWYVAYPGLVTGRHNGKALALFCDGHIEEIDPQELNSISIKKDSPPWFLHLSTQLNTLNKNTASQPQNLENPLISSVFTKKNPVIDGKIDKGEWEQAGSFCGFKKYYGGEITDKDISVFLSYSRTNLNMLIVVPLDKNQKLVANVAGRDDARIWKDDAIELFLKPGSNQPVFHYIVNSRGVWYDSKDCDNSWNGSWKIANYIGKTPEGLKSVWNRKWEKVWLIEASVPLADLGIKKISDGDLWNINICRDGKEKLVLGNTFDRYDDISKFARLTFIEQPVILNFDDYGDIRHGLLNMCGRITNNSNSDITVKVKGTFQVPPAAFDKETAHYTKGKKYSDIIEDKIAEEYSLAPFQTRKFSLNKRIENQDYSVFIASACLKGKKEKSIYWNKLTFKNSPLLDLVIENYPSRNTAIVVLDTEGISCREGLTAKISVAGHKDKTLFEKEFPVTEKQQELSIKYHDWPAGDYVISGVIKYGDGKTASSRKKLSRIEKPSWDNPQLGISDEVLPPWTPLKYNPGNSVSVWGRKIFWGKSLFPESIKSLGKEILNSPIKAYVELGGRKQELKVDTFNYIKKAANRADIEFSGTTIDKLKFKAEAWIEYDGLIWYTINFAGKKQIDAFYLEVPVNEFAATYYSCEHTAACVPAGSTKFGFAPVFTLSGITRGISFACESTRNWNLKYGKSAYLLNNNGKYTTLRVNMIGKKTLITGKTAFSFGLHPFPVKPLPDDWHSWKLMSYRDTSRLWEKYAGQLDAALISKWGARKKPLMVTKSGNSICNQMEMGDYLGEISNLCHKKKYTPAVPYSFLACIDNDSVINPELQKQITAYRYEWLRLPYSAAPWAPSGKGSPAVCLNSSYQNYLLAACKRMIDKYQVDGFYWDGCGGTPKCENTMHGCGYSDNKKELYPTYGILARRRFLKRLSTILYEASKKRSGSDISKKRSNFPDYVIWGHTSSPLISPVHSFLTIHFDGEQFQVVNSHKKHYKDLLSLDYFRAEFLSNPTGIINSFMVFRGGKINESATTETEAALSYLIPHGVPFFLDHANLELGQKVWDTKISFGTRSAKFYPCWTNKIPISVNKDKKHILVACWEKKNKVLAVVSNIGKQDENIVLQADFSFTFNRKNSLFAEKVEQKGRQLQFKLKSHTFNLLYLDKE